MRYLYLILLVHYSLVSFSQVKQPAGETISFVDILYAQDSALKDQLFSRVLEWTGDKFNSSKAVIDVQDRQAGIIIIKAKTFVSYAGLMGGTESSYGDYVVKILIKDSKVKCEIGPFIIGDINLPGKYVTTDKECDYKGFGKRAAQRIWEAYQTNAYETHVNLVHTLSEAINKKSEW